MKTRNPAVEGRFYPSSKQKIFEQIREIEKRSRYPLPDLDPSQIHGAILPHAGHLYSGHQTVPFFQLLQRHELYPETFVILHPNHTGLGLPVAVAETITWRNSAGDVPVDRELAEALELPFDSMAHAREHSAEVIIPFMQYYLAGHPFTILPVCMMDQQYASASMIAKNILKAAQRTGRKIMVLASCDFSHFLSPAEGAGRDQKVIDAIDKRNAPGVEEAVRTHHAPVCGYGPVMALMDYAAAIDREYKIRILARGHSGEVITSPEVVDYISMVMYK
jgi:AmmeMemoRadiSam system protein B